MTMTNASLLSRMAHAEADIREMQTDRERAIAEDRPGDVAVLDFSLRLEMPPPLGRGGSGCHVTVLLAGEPIGTAIENTPYEAAVIGVGLYFRAMAPRGQ